MLFPTKLLNSLLRPYWPISVFHHTARFTNLNREGKVLGRVYNSLLPAIEYRDSLAECRTVSCYHCMSNMYQLKMDKKLIDCNMCP